MGSMPARRAAPHRRGPVMRGGLAVTARRQRDQSGLAAIPGRDQRAMHVPGARWLGGLGFGSGHEIDDKERHMFFLRYLRREIRHRARQGLVVAIGLAVGIALVVVVTAAANGVKNAQAAVLHSLYGIGTDVTVTLAGGK